MSSARDILDQRLAKGEISDNEYDALIAKLGGSNESQNSTQKRSKKKGSLFLGFGGIIVGLLLFPIVADIPVSLIDECVERGGGTHDFCREFGVKWPLVYLAYGFIGLLVVSGIANLVLRFKN